MKNFNGNPMFNTITCPILRAWNRCAIMFNLQAEGKKEEARAYAMQFDNYDRISMSALFMDISANGYEATRRDVNRKTADSIAPAVNEDDKYDM